MNLLELNIYLDGLDIFKPEKVISVEMIDGVMYHLPSSYKSYNALSPTIYIKIYREKYGEQKRCIDFSIGDLHLFGTYVLKEFTFVDLCNELDKFFNKDSKYLEWKLKELRNLNIDKLFC